MSNIEDRTRIVMEGLDIRETQKTQAIVLKKEGLSNSEIAKRLNLKESTVRIITNLS